MRFSRKPLHITFCYMSEESLAIESLSAALKKSGHSTSLAFDPFWFKSANFRNSGLTKLLNLPEKSSSSYIRQLKEFKPDLLAFSIETDTLSWVTNAITTAKNIWPNTPVIAGGIHVSSVPKAFAESGLADILCVGEGEIAFNSLMDAWDSYLVGERPSIPGIWYVDKKNITANAPSPEVQDINSLPMPDKALFYRREPSLSSVYMTMFSRGCPNHCSFCCNSIKKRLHPMKPIYKFRDPELAIEEISRAVKLWQIRRVLFMDDDFICNGDWLEAFCSLWSQKIKLPFHVMISPFSVNKEKTNMLKNAGCKKVSMGIQSISPYVLKELFLRNDDVKLSYKACKTITDSGMNLFVDHIMMPKYKLNYPEQTIKYYNGVKPSGITVNWLRIYPGTALAEIAYKNKWINKKTIQDINDGKVGHSIATGGSVPLKLQRRLAPLSTILALIPLLPRPLIKILLHSNLYKHLYIPVPGLAKLIFKAVNLLRYKAVSYHDIQSIYSYQSILRRIF